MNLFTGESFSVPSEKTVVALGNFDGVHIGHQVLLQTAARRAKTLGLSSLAYVFERHPENVLEGRVVTPEVTPNDLKARFIEKSGVDSLLFEPFNIETAAMSPSDFVWDVLNKRLNAREVVCGFHYHFGSGGGGDISALKKLCETCNISVVVIPPVTMHHVVVSSSIVRSLISEGRVDDAGEYLGHPFILKGEVLSGKKLGRTWGFPTINQYFSERSVIPLYGVYITRTLVDGEVFNSITNVGIRPTVDSGRVNAETNIFDFKRNIYGMNAEIHFLKRIRCEIRFQNFDQLKAQIKKDIITAKEYFDFEKE
ncbi:MAG: bifunctional riboflavin kinase/FAD synthetase [Bacillota bacterium]|nr:bifunctional riboflavin kinase/FAD synthetase [Bacillota bacterium]